MNRSGETPNITSGSNPYNTYKIYRNPYAAWLFPSSVAVACGASLFVKSRHSQMIRLFATSTLIGLAGNAISAWTIRHEPVFLPIIRHPTYTLYNGTTMEGQNSIQVGGARWWRKSLIFGTINTILSSSIIVCTAVLCRKTDSLSKKITLWIGLASATQLALSYFAFKSGAETQHEDDPYSERMRLTNIINTAFPLLTTAIISGVMLVGRFKTLRAA